MQIQSMHFKQTASQKLNDAVLQTAMKKAKGKFVDGRAAAVAEVDAWQDIRTYAAALRDRVIANLDAYLLEFEKNATARGAVVHWAETAEEANAIIVNIAQQNAVKTVTKSKSMVSEEIALNDELEAAGMEVVETDLGEYILQLAHEPPSHIVAPAVHKSKEQVADLFVAAHGRPRSTDITALTREAREVLRDKFLNADMGISGANFVIAETGTTLTVTNEGNADLVTTIPRIHCVVTGIEKVIATLEDFATLILTSASAFFIASVSSFAFSKLSFVIFLEMTSSVSPKKLRLGLSFEMYWTLLWSVLRLSVFGMKIKPS